jgi:hypothetical protein
MILFIGGAIDVARKSRVPLSLAAIWLISFALSLASSFTNVGVRWSFRLPVYVLSMLIAGGGAAWLEARLARGRMLLVVVIAASLACTATLENLRPNAEFVEYCYVRDTLKRLQRPVVGNPESGPGWRLPMVLASRLRLPLLSRPAPGAIFFDGIGCHVWDMLGLLGTQKAPAHQLPPRAEVERVFSVMIDPDTHWGMDAVPHPTGERPECTALLQTARPLGPPGPTVTLEDSPPMAVFGERELTLRVFEWPQ